MLLLSPHASLLYHPTSSFARAQGIGLLAAEPILETTLAHRRPDRQGKVRDLYDVRRRRCSSSRPIAFPRSTTSSASGIPDKGKVLTQLSAFWFERTRPIVDNHLISTDPAAYPAAIRDDAARVPRPIDARDADVAAADRVCRARLSVGIRVEGLPRHRRSLRHPAARRTSGIRSAAASTLHAGDESAERPRHQHHRGAGGRA